MNEKSSSKILKSLENSLFTYSNQLFVIEAAIATIGDEFNAGTGIRHMVHQMACDLIDQQYTLSDIADELAEHERSENTFKNINCKVFVNSLSCKKNVN